MGIDREDDVDDLRKKWRREGCRMCVGGRGMVMPVLRSVALVSMTVLRWW